MMDMGRISFFAQTSVFILRMAKSTNRFAMAEVPGLAHGALELRR